MTDLVTIEGVEIGSVGMNWPASGGVFTLTAENLRDVMVAANDDPHIISPRLKLGHEGWPENDGLDMSPFGTTAEPALGKVVNFRLTNDGATLVGDYVDVPPWVPAAYPSRSGEWVGQVDPEIEFGVQTPGGKRYSIVLTAVALLGVAAPAIQDLEDLESFLTAGTTKAGSVTFKETPMTPVATRADIDTVSRSFWADFAVDDYFWWWPRDIYTDPNEVLADDDEGHLYRVPFASDDNGDITWSEPVRVRLDVVDIPDASPAAAAASYRAVATAAGRTLKSFATATAARPKDRPNPAAITAASTERNPMDDSVRKALAAEHGLDPDTATEEQVNAAVIAKVAADAAAVVEQKPDDKPDDASAAVEKPAEAKTDDEPVLDTVPVSREVWEKTQADLAALVTKDEERELAAATKRRDEKADRWVATGRITPAERDLARTNLDVNEDKTTEAYEALATGRVPVTPSPAAAATSTTSEDALLAASRARMGHTTKEA